MHYMLAAWCLKSVLKPRVTTVRRHHAAAVAMLTWHTAQGVTTRDSTVESALMSAAMIAAALPVQGLDSLCMATPWMTVANGGLLLSAELAGNQQDGRKATGRQDYVLVSLLHWTLSTGIMAVQTGQITSSADLISPLARLFIRQEYDKIDPQVRDPKVPFE
jgi:hypothetical protein